MRAGRTRTRARLRLGILTLAAMAAGCSAGQEAPSGEAPASDSLGDAWIPTSPMKVARFWSTATLLPDGYVHVAGGNDPDSLTLDSVEAYDPKANVWHLQNPMSKPRRYHTATLLPGAGGTVLVAGGESDASSEVYDGASWTPVPDMTVGRRYHTATLLMDGSVLVTGGYSVQPEPTSERYVPENVFWYPDPSGMAQGRWRHTATRLDDGRVLVVGGDIGNDGTTPVASAELYTPGASPPWKAAATSTIARERHTATLLADGSVLVAGGAGPNGSVLRSAQVYDPKANMWRDVGDMVGPRYGHAAALLADGSVLVAGGYDASVGLTSVERYDPSTGTWSLAAPMATARAPQATVLADGTVLMSAGAATATAERLLLPIGAPCTAPEACQTGFCADGVCCTTACDEGPCDACSKAAGAAEDGTCAPLTEDRACREDDEPPTDAGPPNLYACSTSPRPDPSSSPIVLLALAGAALALRRRAP
jgi:MYXO-CTERM domain-containing protein